MNKLLTPHILILILGSVMAAVFSLCGDTSSGLLALTVAFSASIILYGLDE